MKDKKGITGSTLKIIAMICMVIDHIGASIMERSLMSNPGMLENTEDSGIMVLAMADMIFRCIGRIAFPIFIYLIIEGVHYTKNPWKYCGRMFLFAFISEIPFDMAFWLEKSDISKGHLIEFAYQNVFFTLAMGVLLITVVDKMRKVEIKHDNVFLHFIAELLLVAITLILAEFLRTDYGAVGVGAIYAAYLVNSNKHLLVKEKLRRVLVMMVICLVLSASSLTELFALIGIWPVCLYNGKRGLKLKWVFYLFYPVHLLILGLVCLGLGI